VHIYWCAINTKLRGREKGSSEPMMKLEQARIDFAELQKRICAFNHANAILHWDGETVAPPDTAQNRAQATEIINQELFLLKSGEETVELLNYLNEERDMLSVRERRALDYMLRDVTRKSQIPTDEYARHEKLLVEAQYAWHTAVEENNFDLLKDKLGEVFQSLKRFAKYCSPDQDPYEYCMDDHEEGLTIATCDNMFGAVKSNIVPLLHKIKEKPQLDDSPVKGDFSKESQESLAYYIMELLGLNMNKVSLATSEHPFTTFLGSHFDERIATRYSRQDYAFSLYTIINQVGHVLYDMGQDDNLAYTVLDGVTCKSLQEAQGRFYENVIGRSRPFIELIYPDLRDIFPNPVERYTPEDIYRAVNRVEPGFIRMDADELTFNLHVLVRYELEKAIMHDEITVNDLRDAWREKYKEYLDIDVKDDVNGILQDIHWSFGAVGYFPAYVLGNFYSAQLADKMSEAIDIGECISEGDFAIINMWNKLHVWKHGGLYNSNYIMEKHVGVAFDSQTYIKYLTDKYTELYNL